MTEKRATIYLASPLGFSRENNPYRERIKRRLGELGCSVFDPWEQEEVAQRIKEAMSVEDGAERVRAIKEAARFTGAVNAQGLKGSDLVLAVLDGTEPDSGTVAELGYGCGIGKKCYGLRTDFRDCGDFPGVPLNLQVLYFIEESGGRLFRRIEEIDL
ncbi:nucleoside 2-deoxyribosyltransferase [Geomonas sp. Red69]|uniref:nucleoside 2-deoxyribosyltransferase n=1 Tax=Geomonas diazotrophica TaxID=2843197 RepID=UPI001C1218CB|nr:MULTISPECIES: nucleoside 2-deoxyribosyltransferase [Geomonas]MBU5636711.1 nucleoside 2-deoxyribosyltransferase [Geomonas diazotrophica]QXE87656.1 nucleoside 2-deoxyribosyltransferase [Geomonas nitrogeniifigens]